MSDVQPLTAGEQLAVGAESEQVQQLQRWLEHLGHYRGQIDGRYGDTTEAAVRQFQISAGQAESGTVEEETWTLLGSHAQVAGYDQHTGVGQDTGYDQHTDVGQLSEDGQWRWDGAEWVAAQPDAEQAPTLEVGQLSEDGHWQWNGTDWVQPAAENLALAAVDTRPRPNPVVVQTSGPLPLSIVEPPRLEAGAVIAWAVRNDGQTTMPKGTPIGEWEIWDAGNILTQLWPRETVHAKTALPAKGVQWIRVTFQVSPPSGDTRLKVVVQSGQAATDVEFDWADPLATPAPAPPVGPLVFAQRPYQTGGAMRWSVRNSGKTALKAGTPVGEWELWDGDDITVTLGSKTVVTATADIPPNGVHEIQPVPLAPLSRVEGRYKVIVSLGEDIADVDYTIRRGGGVVP